MGVTSWLKLRTFLLGSSGDLRQLAYRHSLPLGRHSPRLDAPVSVEYSVLLLKKSQAGRLLKVLGRDVVQQTAKHSRAYNKQKTLV